jgi:tetratricopeptide (TPR) repeat protein
VLAPSTIEIARRVHALELEAQLVAWRGEVDAANGLDALLDADLGPLALLFENPRHPAWPAARSLEVRAELGRALASVAPHEMLGFEPFPDVPPDVADPLSDPARLALLQRTQTARLDLLRKQFNELLQKVLPEAAGNPAGFEPEDERALQMLELEMEDVVEANRAGRERNDWSDLLELRVPSSSALWLARELRNEGRAEESRRVASAMKTALERSAIAQRYLWSLELEAEIEMTIGSSYSDEDLPEKAELELVKAVERLEAIEKLAVERGFRTGALVRVRALRCGALVALAVNANVKLQDVPKAIAYFERAFELRQDDFMRVLLACYRARAGRADEARALLRTVVPSPGTHYNMACTWALLGERELALDFLARDFEENQLSAGALLKQKEWARADPDLKSLRDDARFRALVGE